MDFSGGKAFPPPRRAATLDRSIPSVETGFGQKIGRSFRRHGGNSKKKSFGGSRRDADNLRRKTSNRAAGEQDRLRDGRFVPTTRPETREVAQKQEPKRQPNNSKFFRRIFTFFFRKLQFHSKSNRYKKTRISLHRSMTQWRALFRASGSRIEPSPHFSYGAALRQLKTPTVCIERLGRCPRKIFPSPRAFIRFPRNAEKPEPRVPVSCPNAPHFISPPPFPTPMARPISAMPTNASPPTPSRASTGSTGATCCSSPAWTSMA